LKRLNKTHRKLEQIPSWSYSVLASPTHIGRQTGGDSFELLLRVSERLGIGHIDVFQTPTWYRPCPFQHFSLGSRLRIPSNDFSLVAIEFFVELWLAETTVSSFVFAASSSSSLVQAPSLSSST
jgi:hypothetical protein